MMCTIFLGKKRLSGGGKGKQEGGDLIQPELDFDDSEGLCKRIYRKPNTLQRIKLL